MVEPRTVGFVALLFTLALSAAAEPVITQILGTSLDYRQPALSPAVIDQALTDLSDQGFSAGWDASPAPWTPRLLENQGQLDYCRAMAAKLTEHGIGTVFVFSWSRLLPADARAEWLGETLDPETGGFETDDETPRWDLGSATARAAFATRSKALFEAVGPFQMFVCDEQIMASPGGNSPHANRMSTYWTSPTYSRQALGAIDAPGSFRHYLAEVGYPGASTAKFPVTTATVEPGPGANMGLPAVPIVAGNADRLQADNAWPDSPLWQHWYDWRTDVYAEWIDAVTTAAHDTWSQGSDWQGCAFSAPQYWFDPALGLDADKIAAVPHVDYLVAGYYSGTQFQAIKAAALRHGKQWGGMVELSHYGNPEGVGPQAIIDTFKANVEAGASLMLVYAGANFRTDRPDPTDNGAYYMPAQVAAWRECIDWLEQGRGVKRTVPKP